jgi:APA family basic amino acid/polyamine antiporter
MVPVSAGESTVGKVTRQIGPLTATSIVVANMIGAGIFTTTGFVAGKVPGGGWVLGCWMFGGLIAIAGALCYVELATRMPEVGGEYVYLKKLYHPALGFLTGWTSLVAGFSAPIAASALGFSGYVFSGLQSRFPAISNGELLIIKKASAIVIILALTGVHYLGIRLGSAVQNILTGIKIAIVLGLASFGLVLVNWTGSALAFGGGDAQGGYAFGTAMMFVMFAYSGWNASAYIAGEMKDPRRTLPLSLLAGTGIVIVLYLAVNLFILQSVPFQQLQGMEEVVKEASVRAFGSGIGNLLGLFTGLALLSSLSAYIILGPRVYFAMAQDRLFLPIVARIHPRYGVPGISILIQGAIAIFMVVTGTLEQITYYVGFALGVFPWLAIAGIFLARKKGIGDASAAKVWGYPVVPVFYLASSLGLMSVAFASRPFASTIALITIALGVPCYFLWVKGMKPDNQ